MEDISCEGCKKNVNGAEQDDVLIIMNDLGYIAFYHKKCFDECPPQSDVFSDIIPEEKMKEHRSIVIDQLKLYAETMDIPNEERYKIDLMISKLMEVDSKVNEV